jgi:quinoprotein glucose dehydrogenase
MKSFHLIFLFGLLISLSAFNAEGNGETTINAAAESKAAAANLNVPATAYLTPRDNLPQYETIPAATKDELTPSNGWPDPATFTTWTRSHGGSAGTRYSGLDQINKQNVSQLTVAWTYRSGDGSANIQCNPIIVDGVIFLPTAGNFLAAVDGATGKEIWRYQPQKQGNGLVDVPARRGLTYWPGDGANPPRLLFTMGTWLYALDPKTGKPIESFGESGRTRLPGQGCSVAPAIYKNVVILPGYANGVFGYDVRTGAPLWTFDTLPTGNEPGADTWAGGERDGANDWGGMALDESRGIAYVATGSPKPNFLGYTHIGDDLYGNCVIALDALTGRYLWHFQEIRHDVWDLDIPAPPILVTVNHDGMKVDAVAEVTKIGNTLLLDRVTGRPLFPFRLRRADAFRLPNDIGSPYQPDVELPQPFARQQFTLNDVTNLSPEAHDAVLKKIQGDNMGWFTPFEDGKNSVYFGIHGGAEWTGAAVDPKGRLYVTASELPWIEGVYQAAVGGGATASAEAAAGKQIFQMNCAACHGAEMQGNGIAPSLIGLGNRLDDTAFRDILHHGRNGMPPQPQLSEEQVKQLVALLLNKGTASPGGAAAPSVRWADKGYTRLLDPQNYPGCTPPWGTLTCIDLNTGKIAWKVPLGEYSELKAKGIPKTGTENFGGATVTAGGLVFAGGTRDNQIRAFDADTGDELWKHDLPLHETAPVAVYEVHGREFVVLPATGGGKLGGPVGDAWVAFALPHQLPAQHYR